MVVRDRVVFEPICLRDYVGHSPDCHQPIAIKGVATPTRLMCTALIKSVALINSLHSVALINSLTLLFMLA